MNTRQAIYGAIDAERRYQDMKWGSHRRQDGMVWLTILVEEVGEAARDVLERQGTLRKELIQVAAVAVAWLEALEEEVQ